MEQRLGLREPWIASPTMELPCNMRLFDAFMPEAHLGAVVALTTDIVKINMLNIAIIALETNQSSGDNPLYAQFSLERSAVLE